jgi:hypothetical protein
LEEVGGPLLYGYGSGSASGSSGLLWRLESGAVGRLDMSTFDDLVSYLYYLSVSTQS